ncbi:MAG TPA: ABC transporter substrate-binding protein, partial [Stellaceae bacterium]|nr:ABC transporter substrate-binding protein [Stellaceae bacterium]
MKAQQDHREILGRREFLGTALAVSATALIRPAFGADAVEAAKSEQGLLWYDHYDRKDALTLMQTFQKAHPFVKRVEFIDVPSAQKTSKLLQESMAGGPTADFLLNDPSAMQKLVEKGFVVKDDWAALGVKTSTATTPSDYMALVTTPVYVVLYNKNQVKDADAPDTWDAVVDPKWTGKTGHWMRAAAFLPLLPAIGEDKTRDIVRRMAATKPR